jgi:hypothetical protein
VSERKSLRRCSTADLKADVALVLEKINVLPSDYESCEITLFRVNGVERQDVKICEISGTHGGENEDGCLPGYCAVQSSTERAFCKFCGSLPFSRHRPYREVSQPLRTDKTRKCRTFNRSVIHSAWITLRTADNKHRITPGNAVLIYCYIYHC